MCSTAPTAAAPASEYDASRAPSPSTIAPIIRSGIQKPSPIAQAATISNMAKTIPATIPSPAPRMAQTHGDSVLIVRTPPRRMSLKPEKIGCRDQALRFFDARERRPYISLFSDISD